MPFLFINPKGRIPHKDNWRDFLCEVISVSDWDSFYSDVSRSLENPSDMNVFTKENMLEIVKGK